MTRKSKHLLLVDYLIEYIHSNKLKPGEKVPSENELADRFNTTKVTASRALNELVNRGILYRVQGKRSFFAGFRSRSSDVLFYIPMSFSYDPYFMGLLLETFFCKMDSNGLNLAMCYFKENEKIKDLQHNLKDCKVVIVAALNAGEGLDENLIYRIENVIYLSAHPDTPVSYIAFDNKGGAKKAVEYLVRMGHRRIAYLSTDLKGNISNEEKKQGYIEGLEENKIRQRMILSCGYALEGGYEIAGEILKLRKRPTAILASSDLIAVGLIRKFSESGVDVPGDISVVGFGNYDVSSYVSVPLTTVSLPIKQMGERLADFTISRVNGSGPFGRERIVLPVELIIRGSVRRIS